MDRKENIRFQLLFEELIRFATSKGVPFVEAEDLAASSVEAAYKVFDPARGSFPPLCMRTMANRLKNYWRDRKPNVPIPEDELLPDPDWEERFRAGEKGEERRMLERIESKLTPGEREFLAELHAVYEELDDRAVSEAARRLGLEPAKGWDIFRRIQRKATALREKPAEPQPVVRSKVADESLDLEASIAYMPRFESVIPGEMQLLAECVALDVAVERLRGRLPAAMIKQVELYL